MLRMIAVGLCFLSFLSPVVTAEDSAPMPIKVMSFNIRFGSANDGENSWEHRKDFVAETIRTFDPDILGTQETVQFQKDFLAEKLPEYEVLGVGRDDGKDKGEMMAVYVRKNRFKILKSGHFWYSLTPQKPGTKAWDSSLPRMATWMKLKETQPNGRVVWYFNTHFDHRGQQARIESAKLLRRRAASMAGTDPVIITGDFNSPEGGEVYEALFAGTEPIALTDTYRNRHPDPQEKEGTFTGFRMETQGKSRIDWIACSTNLAVEAAEIDRTNRDGVTPSDHFPITATLVFE